MNEAGGHQRPESPNDSAHVTFWNGLNTEFRFRDDRDEFMAR
jgi:hypothetical protein